MTIHTNDKSRVSVNWIDGRARITFHTLNKVLVLPVGMAVNVTLVQALYNAYKGV